MTGKVPELEVDTAARLLILKGAQFLEDHPDRWGQGRFEHADGRVCMLGAIGIRERLALTNEHQAALHLLSLTAIKKTQIPSSWMWNDRLGRTPREVVESMREAASA